MTSIRKNMKPTLLPLRDKLLLCKRAIVETIHDQLKNISQIEHARDRSVTNLTGLIAYTHRPTKPLKLLTAKGNYPELTIQN